MKLNVPLEEFAMKVARIETDVNAIAFSAISCDLKCLHNSG